MSDKPGGRLALLTAPQLPPPRATLKSAATSFDAWETEARRV